MSITKINLKEAGYIAQELLEEESLEMASRCETVERTVAGGAFSLARALHLYQVPPETYSTYLVGRNLSNKTPNAH